ncbi:glutamate-rich protein 6B [Eptesicus fuscus]|uniref:glutamate-rich protein 6B n=1 Tax=Eptesicus fuscus TaxID=29078 RepID=UPI0024045D79|nr:glutamate-rich protein 6B [Eptesicus fuscus]
MSTKNSQASGKSSPLLPTTFPQPTQIFSSEKEYTTGEEKRPQENDGLREKRYLEEDDYLEKEKYLEEDDYLEKMYQKGKESLKERESLKEKKYLQKEKDYWNEEDYLEKELNVIYPSHTPPNLNERSPAAGVSQVNTFFTVTPPTFEPASKSPHSAREPSVGFKKDSRRSVPWRDRGTQTESTYENQEPSTSKPKTEQEASTIVHTSKLDSEAHEVPQEEETATKSVPPESFYDTILNEHPDLLDDVDLDDSLFKSSYHTVFQTVIKEQAAHNELEEDTDIPLTGQLESETRRKLRILLKTNIEKYKEVIHWIMEKRGNVYHIRDSDAVTHTFHLLSQSPPIEPKTEEVKKPRRIRRKKKLDTEIDTEWVKSNAKVYQDDVKLILYPNENIFRILFSDESGQIYYPSGHLAVLFFWMQQGQFTYIILDDREEVRVRALINNTGHATVYDENREIWLCLSQNLGYYFAKDTSQKAWNWWNLNLHVHAPPVRSISLDINQYIKVQVKSQDEIIFSFVHQTNRISLNLGTKYRFINPEKLSEMKMKAILEVEIDSTARKIQVLLGKMSRILNFLTICDLETFIESTTNFLLSYSQRRKRF